MILLFRSDEGENNFLYPTHSFCSDQKYKIKLQFYPVGRQNKDYMELYLSLEDFYKEKCNGNKVVVISDFECSILYSDGGRKIITKSFRNLNFNKDYYSLGWSKFFKISDYPTQDFYRFHVKIKKIEEKKFTNQKILNLHMYMNRIYRNKIVPSSEEQVINFFNEKMKMEIGCIEFAISSLNPKKEFIQPLLKLIDLTDEKEEEYHHLLSFADKLLVEDNNIYPIFMLRHIILEESLRRKRLIIF